MEEQLVTTRPCRICGAPIAPDSVGKGSLCQDCAALQTDERGAHQPDVSYTGSGDLWRDLQLARPEPPTDPDRPRWGPLAGIGVWIFSIAATILIPVLAVLVWVVIQKARGGAVPLDPEGLKEWLTSPTLLLVQVVATMPAHLLILAVCWAVVTGLEKRPFWTSLGWNWAGKSAVYWGVVSALVVIGILAAGIGLEKVLPQAPTSFDELLKSGPRVRIAIALLATLTAPLVEEVVYRGVLFAGLRKHLSATATIVVVAVLFSGVHLPQYWGAWATVTELTLLSLILTVIRARTSSLLPCFVVHFLNNAFSSVFILLGKS